MKCTKSEKLTDVPWSWELESCLGRRVRDPGTATAIEKEKENGDEENDTENAKNKNQLTIRRCKGEGEGKVTDGATSLRSFFQCRCSRG